MQLLTVFAIQTWKRSWELPVFSVIFHLFSSFSFYIIQVFSIPLSCHTSSLHVCGLLFYPPLVLQGTNWQYLNVFKHLPPPHHCFYVFVFEVLHSNLDVFLQMPYYLNITGAFLFCEICFSQPRRRLKICSCKLVFQAALLFVFLSSSPCKNPCVSSIVPLPLGNLP